MKAEDKTIKVYIADDGKEFASESECKIYEEKTLKILSNIKYYQSLNCPDLTEGRGYVNIDYIAVYNSNYVHFHLALQYLINKYGPTIEYVQGVAPMPNWHIPKEITKEEYLKAKKPKLGDYMQGSKQILISEFEIEGFCKPINLLKQRH